MSDHQDLVHVLVGVLERQLHQAGHLEEGGGHQNGHDVGRVQLGTTGNADHDATLIINLNSGCKIKSSFRKTSSHILQIIVNLMHSFSKLIKLKMLDISDCTSSRAFI